MKMILASEADKASANIFAQLIKLYDFKELDDQKNVYAYRNVSLAKIPHHPSEMKILPFEAEEIIVASRHVSESGKPSLTVHAPGDLEKGELAIASPRAMKAALLELARSREEMGLGYEVSLEATHHGPTKFEVPITFVEIGSSPEEWADEEAGVAAARAIMAAATSSIKSPNALCLGGPHYAPRHTEVTLRSDIAVGHVLPRYVNYNEELIFSAVRRTFGGVDLFVLDWKGLSADQRQLIKSVSERLGIKAVRTSELLRT
ncbi:MAG: hypothetical protein APU95_05510 [Hadesarchaea archaeon YNP_N21]|nr:MAG: hypothetical protein APU95_05510 [Hadesarchaea archaeon YNP_N21]